MTSSIGNMIISIIDYNACTYGDNANITSFSALVVDIRSTLCEANLNHPLYKGGPITLTSFGVGEEDNVRYVSPFESFSRPPYLELF